MTESIQGACPEPVYPRELRSGQRRFEAVVDMGSDGEGTIVFESTTAQSLIDGLRGLSPASRRVWIEERAREAMQRGLKSGSAE